MSLRAILDVIINFDSFRNIDIYQQGLYNIKVTICQKINGDEYFASPYNLLTKESDKDESRVLEAEIDEIAFTSRSFLIRYNDEEIALNEICLFRMELDHDHLTRNTDIYLKASLMHLSTENLNDNDIMQLSSHKIAEFQSLSNLEIQLKNAVYGINQFYPFVFENQHFCVFSATIHTMLIDFRLRNARLEDTKAHLKHCEIDLANFISQFYFENRSRVGQTEIDEIYNLFVMLLENSYNNNKALISS